MRIRYSIFGAIPCLVRVSSTLLAGGLALLFSVTLAWAIEIEQIKTKGGISAYLVEDYTLPIVAISFSFKGGAVQDESGKEGGVRLMAAMMDEGAGDLESEAFQVQAEENGVQMGFGASRDAFTGSARFLKSDLVSARRLLTLALNEPRFDAEPLERMRDSIRAGIERSRTNPGSILRRSLREVLFAGHPYALPLSGDEATIDALTRADVERSYRRLVARSNLSIGVVGAISKDELSDFLDSVFGKLPAEAQLAVVNEIRPVIGTRKEVNFSGSRAIISLAYPGVKRNDPEFFAAYLLDHVLGGGTFSSRLYREVREKRGLAYGVSSGIATLEYGAYLGISTSTRAENAGETLSVIQSVVADLATNGVTKEELAAAKKYVIGAYAINNLDSSGKVARVLVALQQDNLGIDYVQRRQQEIERITLEQVNQMAKRLLSVEPTIIIVGPSES